MSEQRIRIPHWRPATLNELMRGHWRTKHRLKTRDLGMVMLYGRGVVKANGRRRVSLEITLGPRQQQADPDAYQKSLLDALVRCRLLTDDDEAGVEWGGVTYTRGATPGTTIVLTDLEDA